MNMLRREAVIERIILSEKLDIQNWNNSLIL